MATRPAKLTSLFSNYTTASASGDAKVGGVKTDNDEEISSISNDTEPKPQLAFQLRKTNPPPNVVLKAESSDTSSQVNSISIKTIKSPKQRVQTILKELFCDSDSDNTNKDVKITKKDLSYEFTLAELAPMLKELGKYDPTRPGAGIFLADIFEKVESTSVTPRGEKRINLGQFLEACDEQQAKEAKRKGEELARIRAEQEAAAAREAEAKELAEREAVAQAELEAEAKAAAEERINLEVERRREAQERQMLDDKLAAERAVAAERNEPESQSTLAEAGVLGQQTMAFTDGLNSLRLQREAERLVAEKRFLDSQNRSKSLREAAEAEQKAALEAEHALILQRAVAEAAAVREREEEMERRKRMWKKQQVPMPWELR